MEGRRKATTHSRFTTHIIFKCSPRLQAALNEYAERTDMTKSAILRSALVEKIRFNDDDYKPAA